MEPRCTGSEAEAARQLEGVAEYLDELAAAQVRVLDLLAAAPDRVPDDWAHLVAMSAVSGRLTRRFFDAQRAVLQREVLLESRLADSERATRNAAHRAHSAVADAVRAGHAHTVDLDRLLEIDVLEIDGAGVSLDASAPATIRGTIAHLGTEVLRTLDDVASVREVLEAAFRPDEPDCSAANGALADALDMWWSAREREHQTALADAVARRKLMLHLIKLECAPLLGSTGEAGEPAAQQQDDADSLLLAEPRWADDLAESEPSGFIASLDGDALPQMSVRRHDHPASARRVRRDAVHAEAR
jgi:hypothetical protein